MTTKSSIKFFPAALFLLCFAGTARAAATYDQCLVALNPTTAGALSMSGSVIVNASTCGVVVDSSSSQAFRISGSVRVTAKYIDLVGGESISGSATATPAPQTIASQPDPLAFLVPPASTHCDYTDFKITGAGSSTLNPGTYCNGISISGSATVAINSGTYILLGGGLQVSGSAKLTGTAVTFYLTQNSTYAYGPLSVSGSAKLTLSAPTAVASPYYGILFYQDPSIGTGKPASSVSGAVDSVVEGVFYFPKTGLTYSGSSQSGNYLILIADTLTLSGSVNINGTFPNSRSPLEPPVSVTVSPTSAVLFQGGTQQFTPTVNFSTQGVTWSVTPAGSGTISATGLYTAPSTVTSQQNVTVTAASQEDPTKSATASVTLSPPVSVLVAPATATLYATQTKQFTASVVNSTNQVVAWTLNPAGIGTVSATGFYTAPATVITQQTVSVIATSQADPTKSSAATVTLSPPVAVSIAPLTASIHAGQTQQFVQSVINTTNTAVTWTLNPSTGAGTINTSGLYTPPTVIPTSQSVTVIATSQADTTKSASATVALVPLSITVTPTTPILFVGDTQQFTATITNSNNTAVNWTISPAGVGLITTNGLYTAPTSETSQRTVSVVATSQADSTKSASATVTLPAVSVSVAPTSATLYASQTQRFTASVTNADNTAVNWTVTPSSAGTIDTSGLFTAAAPIVNQQAATITATSLADSTRTASATVTLIPIVITVAPTSATLSATQTQQFTATVTNSNNTSVTWSLSPAGIGTISTAGLYTAPPTVASQQSVTVIAASQADTTKTASATVTLLPSATISITPQTVSLSASQTQQFAATLPNNTSVTWSIYPVGAGTISTSGLYTAPNCITVPQAVTVTATGATDSTKSISATVNLQNANGFSFQRAVTIDSTLVTSDQNNFPLLISGTFSYLATVANGGKVQNANGFDIIFTSDGGGVNKLDHEIDSYNPATGQFQAWVRIPVLSSSANTTIYMFYGNSSITASQESKPTVWDSNYKAVYHLGAVTGTIQDSTTNSDNATANNIGSTAGQFGAGGSFNGTSSYLQIPQAAFGTNSANYAVTFQTWFKTQAGGVILGQTDGTAPPAAPAADGWDPLLAIDAAGNLYATGIFEGGDSPNREQFVACCYSDNAWHSVTYTYSAGTQNQLDVYIDGSHRFSRSVNPLGFSTASSFAYFAGAGFSLPPTPPPVFVIGARKGFAPRDSATPQWSYFNGQLDDMRISNLARSSEWISTEYNSQNARLTFVSIAPENSVGVQVSPSTASLFPSLTQQFQATVTGACGQTVNSQAVTWTVTPTGSGTINSAGLYTAPANVAAPQSVTITARSVEAVNEFGLATVSLQPPVSISVGPQTITMTGLQTQQFNATVTNTTDPSVVWSITPSGAGSIDQNGLYTAPASIASPTTVTVTATSTVDPIVFSSATISLINGSSFTYHRAIEIDHTKVPNTDQTNFPVLISGTYPFLATVANGGRLQNAHGYDILFTADCLGGSKLSHEIESYNPVTGQFVAWVNVPLLSHASDTVIYLSYGNPVISASTENPAGVWDPNFAGVYHLGKNGTLSASDSVATNESSNIDNATAATGLIDGAAGFSGNGEIGAFNRITFPPNGVTLSAWFNTSANQATNSDITLVDVRGNIIAALYVTGNVLKFHLSGGVSQNPFVSSATNVIDGNWHHAVGTYDGTTARLYLDGQPNASLAAPNVFVDGRVDATELGLFFAGTLDETRISTNVRSADWIKTEYNNQISPSTFYTIFPENTASVNITPAATLGLYASQTQQYQAFVLGNCSSEPVTWTVSPAGAGSINAAGIYTAPATISAIQSVTITATSQALSTLFASVTVTLLPPASVSVSPSTAVLSNSQTLQFTASVSNAIITGVTWSLSPAGTGTISATGLSTAPSSIGAQQSVTLTATSLADPTKSASAAITLTPNQGVQPSGGTFAPILTLIAQALCRRPHVAPIVNAGADQFTSLVCPSSGPCGASATLSGSAASYALLPGNSLTYVWSLQTGPAAVQFATATATTTQVSFTAAGTYTLQLTINDGISTSFGLTHVIVSPASDSGGSLYITPTASGPNAINHPVSLQVKFVGFFFGVFNFQNTAVQITVSGANPQTTTVTTDTNGSATFTYTGQNAGADTVVATSGSFTSSAVPVTWITATPVLTSSPVTAQFFTADGSGVFNTPATQQPVFTQVFPNIDFNPVAGAVPNNTSNVSNLTRPFTDVVTNAAGSFAGTIAAQNGTFQAGAGTLYNFSAVFSGSLNVPAAGPVTFTFTSDDAFLFGVGNGATRVSGPQTNTPAATPFHSYPVMGGVNQRSAAAPSSITVNFPAAGFYVYEVDYAKGGDKNLTMTMLSGGTPIPASTLLTLTPTVLPSAQAGQVETLQVLATGTDGVALPGLQVTLNVTGVNPQTQQLTTDGTGQVTFAYVGNPTATGVDQIQATTTVNGGAVYSNVVNAAWNSGTNQAPVVSAGSPQTITLPAPAILNGSISDDGLPSNNLTITWSKQSGPGTVAFDDANQAVTAANFSTAGTYVLQLSASDGVLTTNSTVTITVNAGAGWSTGWIAAPLDGSTVSSPTPITLITGITLISGTLKITPATSAIPILTQSVTGAGQIATFDPTTLTNGSYFIEVDGTNSQGVTQNNIVEVHATGDYKPGRVTATITDLTVPAPGLPIQIQRTYDSLVRGSSGDFGFGWNLGITLQVEISPTADVTLTINGRRRTFFFTPPPNGVFTFYFTPQYTAEPGLFGSLITTGDNCTGVLVHVGQIWECAINNAGSLYQATGYQYTDPSGRVYTMGPTGAIQSVRDLNGNTLTVTAAGISSSNGLSVPFVRDASGRITKITDTLGNQYLYAYDTSGNLVSVTYPSIATPAQYQYDGTHLLTKEIDQRGNTAGTSTYYANGTLQSVTDAVGNTTSYVYNTATNTTTTTNPDGGSVVTVMDAYGSPLSVTDPLGRTTTNSYDANHNLVTVSDPLGHVTTYTYDQNNFRASRKDPLGTIGTATFNTVGGPTATNDGLGNQTASIYDSNFQLTRLSDSMGQVVSLGYDGQGNILSLADAAGSTRSFTYDTHGNLLTAKDGLNNVILRAYDSMGNVSSITDQRGNATQYVYDNLGRLQQATDPAGQATTYAYDGNGNRIEIVDPLQRHTRYRYDAANRPIQTDYADGSSSTVSYDFRGNVLTRTDQAGRTTKYIYDLAGQATGVTTAYGTSDAATTTHTYDAAGRKRSDTRRARECCELRIRQCWPAVECFDRDRCQPATPTMRVVAERP